MSWCPTSPPGRYPVSASGPLIWSSGIRTSIAVEIDGYGPGGPLSHKRAYDLLVQAESGACAITGNPGAPAKPGPPVADISTGLYSALSILALLYSRDAQSTPSGHGNTIGLSLLDTMTELMGYPLTYTRYSGIDQEPLGMSSPAVAPYGAYRTADGQTVVLGTTNDAEWQRLSRQIIARDDLADDPRLAHNSGRCAHRDIVDEAIGAWCAAHDLEHVQKTADTAGIGNSRYNLPSEVLVHPQLTARDRWRQVDTPAGPIQALLPPPVIAGYESPMGAVPGLGSTPMRCSPNSATALTKSTVCEGKAPSERRTPNVRRARAARAATATASGR